MRTKKAPISRIQCEDLPVTITLKAIDLRWLLKGFACAQTEHCKPGTQRWNEGEELIANLRKEINKQVDYEFS